MGALSAFLPCARSLPRALAALLARLYPASAESSTIVVPLAPASASPPACRPASRCRGSWAPEHPTEIEGIAGGYRPPALRLPPPLSTAARLPAATAHRSPSPSRTRSPALASKPLVATPSKTEPPWGRSRRPSMLRCVPCCLLLLLPRPLRLLPAAAGLALPTPLPTFSRRCCRWSCVGSSTRGTGRRTSRGPPAPTPAVSAAVGRRMGTEGAMPRARLAASVPTALPRPCHPLRSLLRGHLLHVLRVVPSAQAPAAWRHVALHLVGAWARGWVGMAQQARGHSDAPEQLH